MGSSISLGEMWVKYKADITDLADKMDTAKSKMKSADDAAKNSGGSIFSSFGNMASGAINFVASAGLALSAVQNFASTAVSMGQSLLQPAESAETMTTAFTTLMGSTSAANDEMQKLDTFASKTPFKTMAIDQAASQLIGFGANVQDVIPDLTAIGDALSAVGRGSEANLNSVVNIFGKVQTEGKLTDGTMQELSVNGINAWSIMEKQTGKTKEELTKMMQQGLIPASDGIKMLTDGIEKNPLYTGGMAKQSATMTGLISTMQSNWDQMMVSFTSPVLQALEPEIGGIGNALASPEFKNFATVVGKDIVTALGNASQFFSAPAFKQFADLVGGQLSTGVKQLADYLTSPAFAQFARVAGQDIAGALLTATQATEGIVSWTIQWHEPILIVGGVLTALFIPAIITSGVQSGIAGGIMAGKFVWGIIQSGVEGAQAYAKIAVWIAGVIASGVQAGIAGAMMAGKFVAGLVMTGVQAGLTAIKFTASLVPAIIGFIVQSTIAAATAIPDMLAGFGAWAVSAGIAAISTLAVIWPVLAVIAVIALIVVAIMHWSDIVKVFQGVWTVVWGAVSGFFSNIIHFIMDNAEKFGIGLFILITGPIGFLALYIFSHWNQIWSFLVVVWANITGLFSTAEHIFIGIGMGMYHGFIGGIDDIIGGVNQFIGFIDGLQIHIPAIGVGPVTSPAFDWGGLGISKIPMLASGGSVAPGQWFVAGDPGPNSELVYGGTSGATVYSHAQSSSLITLAVLAALAQAQQQQSVIHVHVSSPDLYVDGERMTDALGPHIGNKIRLEGGLRSA